MVAACHATIPRMLGLSGGGDCHDSHDGHAKAAAGVSWACLPELMAPKVDAHSSSAAASAPLAESARACGGEEKRLVQ